MGAWTATSGKATRPAGALLLAAVAGLGLLSIRTVSAERGAAAETARERLAARARSAAAGLAAAAWSVPGRPPAAVLGPDGSFESPPEPRPLSRLRIVPGRDPEGDFYLSLGERAETVDGDADRAAGLYRAAAAPERDDAVRLTGLYRRAALEHRRGREAAAAAAEEAFLALLPDADRLAVEALIVRLERRPAEEVTRDLLLGLGAGDDPIVRGLLPAGPSARAALRRREEELATIERIRPLLDTIRSAPEGVVLDGNRFVGWRPSSGGATEVSLAPVPRLPPGIRLLSPGESPRSGDDLVVTATAEAPAGIRVAASRPMVEVRAEARRRARLVVLLFLLVAVAGAAALLLGRRAAGREARAAREREAFVARVGHDLRTPLSLVRMYAETIADGRVRDPEKTREFAGIAAREAERLSALVGDVLDLSRLSAGNGAGRREIDLASLTREVVEAHRPLLERAGLRVETRIDGPAAVRVDPASLRGALGNLLANAATHAADGGEVAVSLQTADGEAELSVADRGPGFPAGMEEAVFERFARGPDAHGRGAGLGLAIVRETAEAHGGRARAAHRPGGGGEVVVTLPLVQGGGR